LGKFFYDAVIKAASNKEIIVHMLKGTSFDKLSEESSQYIVLVAELINEGFKKIEGEKKEEIKAKETPPEAKSEEKKEETKTGASNGTEDIPSTT